MSAATSNNVLQTKKEERLKKLRDLHIKRVNIKIVDWI